MQFQQPPHYYLSYQSLHFSTDQHHCFQLLFTRFHNCDPDARKSAFALGKKLANAKEESRRWKVHWIKRWDIQCPLSPPQIFAIRQALAARQLTLCASHPGGFAGMPRADTITPPQMGFRVTFDKSLKFARFYKKQSPQPLYHLARERITAVSA